jgi:hypothetical protein
MTVSAPAKFQGNLSTFLGGTISFDGKNINGVAANLASPPWFGTITITGSSGTASRALTGNGPGSPPADGNWHTYTADLSSAGWIGNLGVAMTNVTGITVVLEFNDVITETAGFDNFRISPVPEPETWAMLVAGLGLLGLKVLRNARPVQRS